VVVGAAVRGGLVVKDGFWSVFMVVVWWLCRCVGGSPNGYVTVVMVVR
jgi:hypothetical protein